MSTKEQAVKNISILFNYEKPALFPITATLSKFKPKNIQYILHHCEGS